ncbi:MAG: type II toxin-antitoxin system VapC family toxin [Selenomonas ruminantium]|jgi:predicted nucleic acid-binding protein|uniref:Type II toxin-antitoxin system VapC family toxin n=1 Tax=Selenomonas ruminantium TaxID=971 RepID=A0A927WTK7_SELRU|nr:type II toxin-antitoxin system VapC family toxin [Selenomonas ruminantium]
MRIYLDNCCYNRPYDDQTQTKIHIETQAKLDIQARIREGRWELVSSYILEAENAANPFDRKRRDIQSFLDANTKIFVSDQQDPAVRKLATDIMDTGLHLMDACHIACAIIAECDVFLSTDKRVLKYQPTNIRILNPATFLIEEDA